MGESGGNGSGDGDGAVLGYATPADRVIERTQGCWNCIHSKAGEDLLPLWFRFKAQEIERITNSRFYHADQLALNPVAMAEVQKSIKKGIDPDTAWEMAKREAAGRDPRRDLVEKTEQGIRSGQIVQCGAPGGPVDAHGNPKVTDFLFSGYLCRKWTAAQGASVARAGQKADELPEELRERIDGALPDAKK